MFTIATDLNADQETDLVLGNADAMSVSVLYGLGDGVMSSPTEYLVGSEMHAAVAADLNGDGLPDLAAVVRDAARVLLNQGDGTLAPPVAYPTVFLTASLVAADMNGDGAIDLGVGTQSHVDIRLNLGDGTFAEPIDYPFDASGAPLTVADVNGDDVPDFVSLNAETKAIYVGLGMGDGTFAAATTYPDYYGLQTLAVGDLDGDGAIDLAVGEQNTLGVFLNRGDGTFEERVGYPESTPLRTNPNSIVVMDIDGDNDNEVVFVGSNAMAVFINLGQGVFQDPTMHAVAGSDLIAADLNSDGRTELLAADRYGLSIVPIDVATGAVVAPSHHAGMRLGAAATADFDHDGLADIAAFSISNGAVQMFFNPGEGDFSAEGTALAYWSFSPAMLALDVNDDGWADVVTANGEIEGQGTLGVVLNLGGRAFGPPATYTTNTSRPGALQGADFDGDGLLDVAVVESVGENIKVLLNKGAGVFGAPTSYPANALPIAAAAADLNGDDAPDLAVANAEGVGVLINAGSGELGAISQLPGISGQTDGVVALDVDADGKLDLALSNDDGVTLLVNQGDGQFSSGINYPVGAGWHRMAALDVSGEGWPDLAIANFNSMTVSLLVNDGHGGFHPAMSYPAGEGALALLASDFNLDGRDDVAVTLNDDAMCVMFSTCR